MTEKTKPTEKTKKSKEQEDRSFRIYPFNIIEGDVTPYGEADIFPQIKPQKTKQEPDTQKLQRFIEATRRVFDMLLRNPELIIALDKHTTAEIKEILLVDAKKNHASIHGRRNARTRQQRNRRLLQEIRERL